MTRSLCLIAWAAATTACGAAPPRVSATPETYAIAPTPPAVVQSAPAPVEVDPRALALVEELDQLGYPSLRGHALARVHTGRQRYLMNGESTPEVRLGVVLLEDADAFTVVYALAPVEVRTDGGYGREEVRHEPARWSEELARAILAARAEVESDEADRMRMSRDEPGPRLAALLLARGAIANGHAREGRELLALALRMTGPSMPLSAPDDPVPALRGDVALHLLALLMEEYGDEEIGRGDLRERLAALSERFAGSEAAVWAAHALPVLDRLIREDAAGSPAGDALAEAIFALRDSRYGGGDRALVNAGLDAAPALIEILEDERWTRASHPSADLPQVVTYGDVAQQLLSQLSGERFVTVAEGRAWWREVQRLGQAEVLVRQVRAGGYRAVSALRQLLALDGRRGVREATRALATADERLRASIVGALAASDASVPARIYLDEVRVGPLASRLQAAEALQALDDDRWVGPVIELLRRRLEAPTEGEAEGGAPRTHRVGVMEDFSVRRLLDLILRHGGATAIDALAELYPALDPPQRLALLTSTARARPGDEQTERRLQALLAAALEDEGEAGAGYGYRFSQCLGSLGDAAARLLARRLGATFECAVSPDERARERVVLRNLLRRRDGEPEVSPPPVPTAAPLDQSELDAATLALRTATRAEAIAPALRRFDALGPSAAPRLAELAEELEEGDPRREPARASSCALASRVVDVAIVDAEAPLGGRDALTSLEGQTLEPIGLARAIARTILGGRGAATLHVHRDGAGRGVRVRVRSRPNEERWGSRLQLGWAIRVADGEIESSQQHLELRHALGMRGYRELMAALEALLDAAPDVEGEAQIDLSWSWSR